MRVSSIHSPIFPIFLPLFLATALTGSVQASVVKIDRLTNGTQDLYLLFADSPLTPDIAYDRVMERIEIVPDGEALTPSLQESLEVLPSTLLTRRITAQPEEGRLFIYLSSPAQIRTYRLDLPPVLIVQLESAVDRAAHLPYELDESGYWARVQRAERRGELQEMVIYLEHLSHLHPDSLAVLHQLGIAFQRIGNWARALECFAQTSRYPPLAKDAFARRTLIFAQMRDTTAAFEEWREWAELSLQASSSNPPQEQDKAKGAFTLLSGASLPFSTQRLLSGILLALSGLGMLAMMVGSTRYKLSRWRSPSTPQEQEKAARPENSPYSSDAQVKELSPSPQPRASYTPFSEIFRHHSLSHRYKPETPPESQRPQRDRERKVDESPHSRLQEVLELHRQGQPIGEIARRVGLSRDEVSLMVNLAHLRSPRSSELHASSPTSSP